MEPRVLGQATAQYDEWLGTFAADNSDIVDALEALAGIDPDKWSIVGVSVFGGRVGSPGPNQVYGSVYAVDRSEITSHDELQRVAMENEGRIPVTEFDITDDAGGGLALLDIFKRWSIHSRASSLERSGIELEIVKDAEPEDNELDDVD